MGASLLKFGLLIALLWCSLIRGVRPGKRGGVEGFDAGSNPKKQNSGVADITGGGPVRTRIDTGRVSSSARGSSSVEGQGVVDNRHFRVTAVQAGVSISKVTSLNDVGRGGENVVEGTSKINQAPQDVLHQILSSSVHRELDPIGRKRQDESGQAFKMRFFNSQLQKEKGISVLERPDLANGVSINYALSTKPEWWDEGIPFDGQKRKAAVVINGKSKPLTTAETYVWLLKKMYDYYHQSDKLKLKNDDDVDYPVPEKDILEMSYPELKIFWIEALSKEPTIQWGSANENKFHSMSARPAWWDSDIPFNVLPLNAAERGMKGYQNHGKERICRLLKKMYSWYGKEELLKKEGLDEDGTYNLETFEMKWESMKVTDLRLFLSRNYDLDKSMRRTSSGRLNWADPTNRFVWWPPEVTYGSNSKLVFPNHNEKNGLIYLIKTMYDYYDQDYKYKVQEIKGEGTEISLPILRKPFIEMSASQIKNHMYAALFKDPLIKFENGKVRWGQSTKPAWWPEDIAFYPTKWMNRKQTERILLSMYQNYGQTNRLDVGNPPPNLPTLPRNWKDLSPDLFQEFYVNALQVALPGETAGSISWQTKPPYCPEDLIWDGPMLNIDRTLKIEILQALYDFYGMENKRTPLAITALTPSLRESVKGFRRSVLETVTATGLRPADIPSNVAITAMAVNLQGLKKQHIEELNRECTKQGCSVICISESHITEEWTTQDGNADRKSKLEILEKVMPGWNRYIVGDPRGTLNNKYAGQHGQVILAHPQYQVSASQLSIPSVGKTDHRQIITTLKREGHPDVTLISSHLISGENPSGIYRYLKRLQILSAIEAFRSQPDSNIKIWLGDFNISPDWQIAGELLHSLKSVSMHPLTFQLWDENPKLFTRQPTNANHQKRFLDHIASNEVEGYIQEAALGSLTTKVNPSTDHPNYVVLKVTKSDVEVKTSENLKYTNSRIACPKCGRFYDSEGYIHKVCKFSTPDDLVVEILTEQSATSSTQIVQAQFMLSHVFAFLTLALLMYGSKLLYKIITRKWIHFSNKRTFHDAVIYTSVNHSMDLN